MRTMRIAGTSSKPLFHSPDRLIVGNAPLVGVLDLPGTYQRPPIRLFFPATTTNTRKVPKPASYFVDNRVAYVLQGFAHIVFARHTTRLHRWILRPFFWLLSLLSPVRFLKIPGTVHVKKEDDVSVVEYVPPSSLAMNDGLKEGGPSQQQKTQSLVVFSHGLTGTGEENSIFCASLAKRGYVVASIHHRDGSSCRVPMPDGSCRYYEHLPTGDEYDPSFRLEQIQARAKEFLYSCSWLMGEKANGNGLSGNDDSDEGQQHPIVDQIRQHLDKQKIIAAGFSYGAATASLAATLEPTKFQCAIFLDGWFHIDRGGVEFDFPSEAFGAGRPQTTLNTDTGVADTDCEKEGLTVPSLFVNSSQFQGYTKLYGATQRLADQINACSKDNAQNKRAEMHVIPGTQHQNFCDVIFWLPRRLSKKCFQLGDADAYEAYESTLKWTIQFLERF
mmetsp:Transcript_644/g.1389  ORF Transcript_644/g.1389 Transcript_644/m.1389 type:complete len:445 (-) Transcript_644:179-1513(-)